MNQTKKLLLIFQLNQTLLYINNRSSKTITFGSQIPMVYHQRYKNYDISFRRGRVQFLDNLFQLEANKVDLAIWSHLDSDLTQNLSQKFFARYYRSLLFVMPTNRQLYPNSSPQQAIKIRKDLNHVYRNFPQYNQGNTLVIGTLDNLLEEHKPNDLIIPKYSIDNPKVLVDPGLQALCKYLKGILILQQEKRLEDIRPIASTKQVEVIFQRLSHHTFTEIKNN